MAMYLIVQIHSYFNLTTIALGYLGNIIIHVHLFQFYWTCYVHDVINHVNTGRKHHRMLDVYNSWYTFNSKWH